jgi:hypothetical protein
MKQLFEKLLAAKEEQRKKNAARPIAEKLRMLDRLKERSEQLKRARPAKGRG